MDNKKIKILFFHFDLGNGGAEKVLVNLANSLDHEKYDVEIRTLFDDGPNKDLISDKVRYSSVFKFKGFRGCTQLLKLLSPRILHKLFIRDKYNVEIAFREGCPSRIVSGGEADTPKFSWVHTTLQDEKIASRGYRSIREFRECNSKFKKIAAVSGSVCDSVKRVLPDYSNFGVVYNVIDPSEIKKKASEPIENDLKGDGNTVNLITVGRLTAVKSFDRLLKSLKALSNKGYNNWHLYIVGIGELEDSLVSLTSELDLAENVTFLGYQDNPHKFVAKMDLYVCSSVIEGYSTAVTEAIINQVPVLTTDCSGMREILGDSEAGIIVENSQDGLTSGLEKVLTNPEYLKLLKSAAVTRSSFFSKENSIKQFEHFVFDE